MTSIITRISLLALVFVISVAKTAVSAFSPSAKSASSTSALGMANQEEPEQDNGGIFGAIGNFFDELDAFVDDATSRRLGNGAAFYGKRKSSFYGKDDSNKKKNRNVFDNTEDYRGPAKAGYFQWMMDEETGEMKPVSRLKKRNLEKRL